jgi:hypothetical protein
MERNPAAWGDFSPSSPTDSKVADKTVRALPSGLVMTMHGLPQTAEGDSKIDPIKSDELLKRAKFNFPIYAYAYNWLESNGVAAENLIKQ